MASYSVAKVKNQTLAASTVDTVTLTGGPSFIEVSNWGSVRISFTVDGSTPTVGGDDCYPVGPGGSYGLAVTSSQNAVKLIAAAANEYSVVGS